MRRSHHTGRGREIPARSPACLRQTDPRGRSSGRRQPCMIHSSHCPRHDDLNVADVVAQERCEINLSTPILSATASRFSMTEIVSTISSTTPAAISKSSGVKRALVDAAQIRGVRATDHGLGPRPGLFQRVLRFDDSHAGYPPERPRRSRSAPRDRPVSCRAADLGKCPTLPRLKNPSGITGSGARFVPRSVGTRNECCCCAADYRLRVSQ